MPVLVPVARPVRVASGNGRPGGDVEIDMSVISGTRAIRTAACALAAAVVLGACGGTGPSTAPGDGITSEPGGTMTSSPEASGSTEGPGGVPPAKETPTPGTGHPTGPKVLTGTVSAGVEPKCLILDGYLLVGGPPEVLRVGARVVVTGQVQADLITTCQQGTPFLVAQARPA